MGKIDWLTGFCRRRKDKDHLIEEKGIREAYTNTKKKLSMDKASKNIEWILRNIAGYICKRENRIKIEKICKICNNNTIFYCVNE